MKRFSLIAGVAAISVLTACSTSFLKYEKEDQLKKIDEFDKAVKIEEPSTPAETDAPAKTAAAALGKTHEETKPATTKSDAKKKAVPVVKADKKATAKASKKGAKVTTAAPTAAAPTRRQPDIEDDAGFNGRRPIVDPFRVGEEVTHEVSYFKMAAGEMKFKTLPMATVNGRKSYKHNIAIKTISLFASVYTVEDSVDIFMDYDDVVPTVFELHVKESGQLREAKMLFDNVKKMATFWEKKVTKQDGEEEKREQWEIEEYAQNVYSSIFYMRMFQWEVGKEYAFRVSNDKENLTFSGKALRKEILDTELGPMKAIVIQPNITLKGKFKPIGENLIWLSDDEHKYILRIEAKIKIGTLVSQVVAIKPGKAP
ncbi:DUF3108 domain-containing protein [Bdellovibrio sp. SKB1291214]|uniref:DUF3108 domain-containing protein n=1 Tax=Bdellovibrio sp. SKB1291214 TaxID=1732569 RepID=UPI0020CF1BF0|nr:DUF3108 domain-containing protein [Bdellovibrio sp. SKB1291214]UYL08525.1 DUF3108 domain-containing protein [Bdellovibrio sp. SKB1291214]